MGGGKLRNAELYPCLYQSSFRNMLTARESGEKWRLFNDDDIRILVKHRDVTRHGAFGCGATIEINKTTGAQKIVGCEWLTGVEAYFASGEAF